MKFTSFVLAAASASIASAAISPLRRHATRGNSPQRNLAPITSTLNGFWFDVEVQVGDQSFFLLADTSSSDTRVAKIGYHCISKANNTELPQGDCGWLPTFHEPDGFEYVQNQTFGLKYGTGISLGQVGITNVTLGGITVSRQRVGIVESTNDKGDGINGGVLGLGYPALTSAHYGLNNFNNTEALITNRAIYDPLFFNMHKNLVDSWYSVAFERPLKNSTTSLGGWLGLAVAPIEITKNIPDLYYSNEKPEITLMTLNVDSVTWGKGKVSKSSLKTNSTNFQAVVDTGNSANQLPAELAAEINAAFDPPAQFSEDLGAVDLVQEDASTGLCYSVIAPPAEDQGISLNFLGDAFLRNVVSVYDIGENEMRFAARTEDTAVKLTPTAVMGGASAFRSDGIWTLMVVLGLSTQLIAFM